MNAKTITSDVVVEAYIKTRDQLDELAKEYKERVAKLNETQNNRIKWLQQQLDATGQESAKTKYGTFFKKKSEYVGVEDMDKLIQFIKTNEAWDLLNKVVNKSAALERMGENRDISKVPGVKYSTEVEVQVRRA